MYRSAELRFGSLKERVESQHSELQKLQVRLAVCGAGLLTGASGGAGN